jgi:hypothetical protein
VKANGVDLPAGTLLLDPGGRGFRRAGRGHGPLIWTVLDDRMLLARGPAGTERASVETTEIPRGWRVLDGPEVARTLAAGGCAFCCDAGADFDYCRVCGRGEQPSPPPRDVGTNSRARDDLCRRVPLLEACRIASGRLTGDEVVASIEAYNRGYEP